MILLFCFQVLLFFVISIQDNLLQSMKQHKNQNLDIVKDVKFSTYSGNPYILACNSSSQCQDTVLDECVMDFPEQNTWYYNCFCDGNGPCKTNRDCCNNNCINEVCTHNGGEQGTVCSGACSTCASNYECQLLPGDVGVGFCDYSGVPATTKNYPGGNPWIYASCPNGPSDCQGTMYDNCIEFDLADPNTWVCWQMCNGNSSKINKDCVNNDCVNGTCSSSCGLEGTLCNLVNESCGCCSQGLTCYWVIDYVGYCG